MKYTEAITTLLTEHDKIFSPNERPAYTRSEALLIAANFLEKEGTHEEKARKAAFDEKKKQEQTTFPFSKSKHELARHKEEQRIAEAVANGQGEKIIAEWADENIRQAEATAQAAIDSENRAFAAVKESISKERREKAEQKSRRSFATFTYETVAEKTKREAEQKAKRKGKKT